ncbi:MAG: hypothetical protein M3N68_09395, partial [Actinomycetota bacterium]|nr:hypothetical protein [Actinomycetota bacterium]
MGLTALALVLYTRNRGVPGAEPFFDPVTPAVALVFPALGAFLVSRRPGQAVGWLFCTAVLLAVALFADQYAAYALATSPGSLPGGLWMAWIGSWVWIPGFLAIRTLLLLLFPDGRPPSAHWTPVARLTAAVIGAMTVLAAVANLPGLDAPSAVKALPHLSGLLLAPIALAGLIARYRRSVGLERAQLRWFTVAAAAATLVPLLAAAFALLTPSAFASPWLRYLYQGAGVVSLLALPAATVVALLRHRLYDLDAYDLDTLVDRSLLYAG